MNEMTQQINDPNNGYRHRKHNNSYLTNFKQSNVLNVI